MKTLTSKLVINKNVVVLLNNNNKKKEHKVTSTWFCTEI